MSISPTRAFLERLDAVEKRLMRDHALRPDALTTPDTKTGEQWDAGQVWAHLAEILAYWLNQATLVIEAHSSQSVPFGRIKSDEGRVAAIGKDHYADQGVLRERLRDQIAELHPFLLQRGETDWLAKGNHQTPGVMSLERIVDEFMVGHLEDTQTSLMNLRVDE